MSIKKPPINATSKDNIIYLDTEKRFGDTHLAGLQHKAMAHIDGHDKFVKLDEISPQAGGNWKPKFDYQYSSISESIVSCLVHNIKQDNFDNVEYAFGLFQANKHLVTGTSSNNFLKHNEVERVLSSTSQTHTAVKLKDYVSSVVDEKMDNRFTNLVNMFTKQSIPQATAEHFIVQQAGFDVLVGNTDRLNNPGNFTFAYDVKTNKCRPINLDFGRCLSLPTWSTTAEAKYDFDPEFYDEDIDDFAHSLIKHNDAICSSYDINESIDFLHAHDFTPFNIDIIQLHKDLDKLNTTIQNSNAPCKKFAKIKIDAFKHMLTLPEIQPLWKNISIDLKLEDLDERGQAL